MTSSGGSVGGVGGAGGGGPAPFLLKTYEMVDDSATDGIVSWSSNNHSFVVWNPPEFARLLLPTYFKHNNFSSFIRQLNTYGFRKIDPERWEFANEDFVKDQKHLLKNIHRRKPIHSHGNPHGSTVDPERAAFDEEIGTLSRDKDMLEANILRSKQQRSAEKLQLEEMTQRLDNMERRQEVLITTLEKAVRDPTFVEHLARKIESTDFSAYSKKRRLPQLEHSKPIMESSLLDNSSSSRAEFGNIFHQDFSNKLRLELSPAISDINLVSHSTQCSNEDGESPNRKISEGDPKDVQTRTDAHSFAPDGLELSDTGTFPRKIPPNGNSRMYSLQQRLNSTEEVDGHVSCHLNLTLASSSVPVNKSSCPTRMPQQNQEIRKSPESIFNVISKGSDVRGLPKKKNTPDENTPISSSQEPQDNNQGRPAAPARVNDLFWEQFLTERPGSSDNEEASSTYRANPYEEQEDRRLGHGISRNFRNIDQLSL